MRRTPGLMSVACLLVVAARPGAAAPRAGGISPRNPQASPDRHVAPEQLRLRRNPPRAEARRTGTRAGRVREGLRELSRPAGREPMGAAHRRKRTAAARGGARGGGSRSTTAGRGLRQPSHRAAGEGAGAAGARSGGARREFEAIVDDIFIVFDIDMRGREAIRGTTDRALAHAASEGETADARGKADAEVLPPRLDQRVRS